MIKKIIPVIFCVFLCFIVSLIFTRVSNSWTTVDDTVCFECHGGGNPDPDGEIHSKHKDIIGCSGLCHEVIGDSPATSKCIVCHPRGDVGECNLENFHDSDKGTDCLVCHTNCLGGGTTTTTAPSLEHIEICLGCHWLDDLHRRSGHRSCTQCHDTTDEGEIIEFYVEAGKCVVCHPMDGPGKCNLTEYHGSSPCIGCHTECAEDTTTTTIVTTTTTTIEVPITPVTVDITFIPDAVFRSHLVPFVLSMFIEGTGSNFNETTMVSFESDAICPPFRLVLSPTSLFVLSIINPAGLEDSGSSEVTVDVQSTVVSGEGESFEEVGSGSLYLIMLPFILDEEKIDGGEEKRGIN